MRLPLPWGAASAKASPGFLALFDGLAEAALWLDAEARVKRGNPALRQALGPALPVQRGAPAERLFAASHRPALRRWLQGGERPAALGLAAPEGEQGMPVAPHRIALPEGDSVLVLRNLTQDQAMADRVAEGDRLQALGVLAGGIAHDFNNLLAVVLGATEDAVRLAGPGAPPALLTELAQVQEAAGRGAALVRQMMAYARQQVLAPRLVPLNEAVEGMAQLLRPLLGRSVALVLELDSPGRLVRIDPTQLDRVLMNLAMNAHQAMPRGGRLVLRTGRALLLQPQQEGAERIPAGRWTVLEVEDSGEGIPPEILPRIFEPFFTGRGAQGGTGMGLATVHGIVRQSGGYISVRSRPGEGACFRILLPRVEEAAEPAPAPATPGDASAAAPGRLLLVEDEAPLRRLAERALARAGWEVMAAEDAESALELLEGDAPPPALLVSDVVMPGMDGVALAGRVRERFPGLPVLLVSGYAPSMVEQGLPGGALHFLAKPYRPAELVEAARRAAGAESPLQNGAVVNI
ncbi:ATP-binding protein [Pseudoroseomonas cervicalis]|uniref:ATP-binding protein n=1 Tax=Teichococcus cervicalis TaxID=204525 RepID=UPI0022F169BF|nr:ATP-binding protein [Pseudoroseomonas cervicalis]WBV41705.1 response regulator [Pseudoroseomonas cervicalis]